MSVWTNDLNQYNRPRNITIYSSTQSSSFLKPGTYITHSAIKPLSDITEVQMIR